MSFADRIKSTGLGFRFAAAWSFAAWLAVSPGVASDAKMRSDTETHVKQATLFVKTFRSEREKADTGIGTGSGFFINSTGLAISNNHVVDPTHMKSPEEKQRFHYEGGKLTWKVVVNSGTPEEKTYEAKVIYQNEQADQALLQVYEEGEKMFRSPYYLRLQPESRLQQRDPVWGLGFPGGATQGTRDKAPPVQVETGNILEYPRTPGGRIRKVYTDVVARPGNSGGPQVDAAGFLVGTATLMQPPEGREDTGGAKYTALVPARLTAEMVRNAFQLGKIPPGTDFSPFMDYLTEQSGLLRVPEFDRRADKEVIYFTNGDRVFGEFGQPTMSLETEIGKIEVPTKAVAYIMNSDTSTGIYLEGGNRIVAGKGLDKIPFTPDGGSKGEVEGKEISTISFRTGDRQVDLVKGKVIVLDGNLCHLVLSEPANPAKFTGRAGTIDVALDDIERIELSSGSDQVITLADERRLTGKFEKTPVKAKIAATGTPVEIDLSALQNATIEVRHLLGTDIGGLSLAGIMFGARREFRKIAQTIESDKPEEAKAQIEKLMEKTAFAKLPALEKDQLRLLEAALLLRTGDYAGAGKAFRPLTRSDNANIKTFAAAAAELLKRYPDGMYEGKPLSDRATFAAAGRDMAEQMLRDTRDAVKDVRALTFERKGDFERATQVVQKFGEDQMSVAAVFFGTEPEDLMTRLWRLGIESAIREVARLDEEIKEARENTSRRAAAPQGGRRGGPVGNMNREVDELNAKKEKTIATARDFAIRRWDYGFWIEDPDIEDLRVKQRDNGD